MSKSFEKDYRKYIENNTPDIWDRIEEGVNQSERSNAVIEFESDRRPKREQLKNREISKKTRFGFNINQIYTVAGVVAALAVMLIGAPIVQNIQKQQDIEDRAGRELSTAKENETTASTDDSADDSLKTNISEGEAFEGEGAQDGLVNATAAASGSDDDNALMGPEMSENNDSLANTAAGKSSALETGGSNKDISNTGNTVAKAGNSSSAAVTNVANNNSGASVSGAANKTSSSAVKVSSSKKKNTNSSSAVLAGQLTVSQNAGMISAVQSGALTVSANVPDVPNTSSNVPAVPGVVNTPAQQPENNTPEVQTENTKDTTGDNSAVNDGKVTVLVKAINNDDNTTVYTLMVVKDSTGSFEENGMILAVTKKKKLELDKSYSVKLSAIDRTASGGEKLFKASSISEK